MVYKRLFIISIIAIFGFTSLLSQQRGKATFYSKRATGARTANGERLHHDSMTCAHRTYPFGTLLRVTNPANGNEVVVRVTDRGPFVRGRIIDLSWGAAKKLGIISQGVAMVVVTPIGKADRGATGIPYKNEEPVLLPEIDFEVHDAGYSFINSWQEEAAEKDEEKAEISPENDENSAVQEQKTTVQPERKPIVVVDKKPTSANKKAATANKKTATANRKATVEAAKLPSATQKPTETKKENNVWSEIFDKLKNIF